MRAPAVEGRRHGVDDLPVQVKAEVVAGGEVGEPLVADADHAAVDLFDDRVRHRIRALELSEIAAGSEPPIDPARGRAELGPGANGRASSSHERKHRPQAGKPLEVRTKLSGPRCAPAAQGGSRWPS